MNTKDMKRTHWPRILRKDYIAKDFTTNGRQGQMSLSILRELTAPLTIHYQFGDILIADKDYSWLQVALKDQFVWLTAMYDDQGRLKELYFDITGGNRFDDPENPCFEDMYLDIVVTNDGRVFILDQDELDEALETGAITRAQYDRAEANCKELYEYLLKNQEQVISRCAHAYEELRKCIP